MASDGRVKGYCAIAKQSVDFLIKKQRTAETKAEISAGLTPMREGRDSRGHFVKGNVPRNKRGAIALGVIYLLRAVYIVRECLAFQGFTMKHLPPCGLLACLVQ